MNSADRSGRTDRDHQDPPAAVLRSGGTAHPLGSPPHPASSQALAVGGEGQSRPGTAASHSTPSLTAPVRHCPNVRPNVRPTERPRQLAPSRSASPSRRVLSRHFAHHSHCRPPSAPPKAPADRRQPPVYPNSSPDHRACNSLTPLPLFSRRPSVSIGGFGVRSKVRSTRGFPGTRRSGTSPAPTPASCPALEAGTSSRRTTARRWWTAPTR